MEGIFVNDNINQPDFRHRLNNYEMTNVAWDLLSHRIAVRFDNPKRPGNLIGYLNCSSGHPIASLQLLGKSSEVQGVPVIKESRASRIPAARRPALLRDLDCAETPISRIRHAITSPQNGISYRCRPLRIEAAEIIPVGESLLEVIQHLHFWSQPDFVNLGLSYV